MNFVTHPSNNMLMKAPEGASNVSDLPVTVAQLPSGERAMISFWQPDAEELAALNAGSPVMLHVLSQHHPVVMLAVAAEGQERFWSKH